MTCCTPEAVSLVCLLVSAIAAIAGHWKLGAAVPVWDAASLLRSYSVAQVNYLDNRDARTQLAVDVLTRNSQHWTGHSQAALMHEALGRMHWRDGDFSAALKEIRKAAKVVEVGFKSAEPADVIGTVRARVRVEEAELLLKAGDYDSAIDAVGDSMSSEANVRMGLSRLRVQSLRVLITAAIRMSPSAEELQGIQLVFDQTKQSIEGHADAATKVIIYDVAASLAEAQQDLQEAVQALDMALAHCRRAGIVGESLKRPKDRGAGDAAQTAQLADLHSRMSQALQKRAGSGDFAQAESHRRLSLQLSQDSGIAPQPAEADSDAADPTQPEDANSDADSDAVDPPQLYATSECGSGNCELDWP